MRACLVTFGVLLFSASACVTPPEDDRDDPEAQGRGGVSRLSSSVRDPIVKRIRAQFPSRGIVKLKEPTIPGSSSRKEALIALGRALVFDKILSDNKDISCMTCHPPAMASDDDRHLSLGVRGQGMGPVRADGLLIPRNAPPLFNLHLMPSLFWDGRVEKLPDGSLRTPAGAQLTPQMTAVFEFGALSAIGLFPVTNRDEMREHLVDGQFDDLTAIPDGNFTAVWGALMTRLRAIPQYRAMFAAAYPEWPGTASNRIDTMTFAHASNAMAAFFIAKFTSRDSRWDEFVGGKDDAFKELEYFTASLPTPITELAALQGAERFMATCANCHNGPLLSDNRFHNTALAQFGPGQGDGEGFDDFGRARVTTQADPHARCGNPGSNASCRYAFRTTPLRNVLMTAPFGHAGEIGRPDNNPDFFLDIQNDFADLRAFVAHYAVNPADNLRAYDVTQVHASLHATLIPNTEDIIAHIDPLFATGSPIVPADVDILTAFMVGLTSMDLFAKGLENGTCSQLAMCNVIPPSVPSGLPVDGDPRDAGYCHDDD